MNKPAIIITPKNISVVIDNKQYMVPKTQSKRYDDVKAFIKNQDYEGLIDYLANKIEKFKTYMKGVFKITESGQILDTVTNVLVHPFLSKRILEWQEEGLPFEPLMALHRNCVENESYEATKDLYEFLEVNSIAITDDGCFLAYKKVTTVNGVLKDSHSKKIDNSIGLSPKMPRELVDKNRNNTCSTGLHVGAFQYVNSFSGDTTILVKVNPKNVVAVPPDYNQQKMRVCEYEVVSVYGETNEIKEKHKEIKEVANKPAKNTKESKNNVSSNTNITLPSYENINTKELVEFAIKHFGLTSLTDSQKRKDRLYKKLQNLIKDGKTN